MDQKFEGDAIDQMCLGRAKNMQTYVFIFSVKSVKREKTQDHARHLARVDFQRRGFS